mgnify:CR=1 FL=1
MQDYTSEAEDKAMKPETKEIALAVGKGVGDVLLVIGTIVGAFVMALVSLAKKS